MMKSLLLFYGVAAFSFCAGWISNTIARWLREEQDEAEEGLEYRGEDRRKGVHPELFCGGTSTGSASGFGERLT